jgi:hypothetical protein
MESLDAGLVQRLQAILGVLVCEFRYLLSDIELSANEGLADATGTVAKLQLASFCADMAERIVCEDSVVALLATHKAAA